MFSGACSNIHPFAYLMIDKKTKSDQITEEIKSRIDIVDLIAEHLDLKRAGQNFRGLCPFHHEKTPSFMINPSKQIFHCFGCHKGGDIFTFMMNYDNMTFQEALVYLSRKAGVRIEQSGDVSSISRTFKDSLFSIQLEALSLFKKNLELSRQASAYLKERGLNQDTLEMFSIGYSKNERESLFTHLKNRGYSLELIRASGLVYFGENGQHDFFRDRIMFPIADLQGRVIAYGGRLLSPIKSAPKYLNSPESAIFKKGESLYALNIAKAAITRKGYTVIVEGYLDAIMCHQYGFNNTVAPLGTALTFGHVKKLRKLSGKLLLIFDGDAAGMAATKRSLEIIYSEGLAAKILVLPEDEDPDSFIRKQGPEYFKRFVSKATTPVKFLLKSFGKDKLDAVRYTLSLLLSCPDLLLREETISELSESSKISELVLREELSNLAEKKSKFRKPTNAQQVNEVKETSIGPIEARREERILLNIALSVPGKASFIVSSIDIDNIESPFMRGLLKKIKGIIATVADDRLLLERLLKACDAEEQSLVTKLLIRPEMDHETIDKNIEDCLSTIAIRGIENKIKSTEQGGDEKLLHTLLFEKNKLLIKKTARTWGARMPKGES